jgi:hypothetical protein
LASDRSMSSPGTSAESWFALRQIALTQGIDALPRSSAGGGNGGVLTSREFLQTLLDTSGAETSPAPLDHPTLFRWPFFGFQGEPL